MTTLAEKIAVMQAAERGEKIEYSPKNGCNMGRWFPYEGPEGPGWNFNYYIYRVAPRELKIWVWEWVDEPGNILISTTKPGNINTNILSEQTITY